MNTRNGVATIAGQISTFVAALFPAGNDVQHRTKIVRFRTPLIEPDILNH